VQTAPTPGQAHVTIEPTENQCDCTAAPSSPVAGSRATIEYVPERSIEQILARVRRIPPGYVRTYGDVSPGAPRYAGTALRKAPDDVPWWRVVRSDGSLAQGARQAALLRDEGVLVRRGRVDLRRVRLDDLDVI
jgi:alkylated DNA nucleotide flippase Atl1